MNIFKRVNVKLFLGLLLVSSLAACQSTKSVQADAGDTTAVVVPWETGNGSSTSGLDEYGSVTGEQVDASTNGVVKDAYGNIIGEMVNGVFVPCENCPQAGATAGNGDPLSVTTIYFDYDQTSIKSEFRDVIAAHAANVAASGMQLRLEGHADERGSREYNIGLGERRAQAVKRAMMLSGASSRALTTVSYGEEQPEITGSSEGSYRQNRRVVLIYR